MHEANRKTIRNFGLGIGIAFLIVGTRLYFKHHNYNFLYLGGIGIIFMILGIILPISLKPIYAVCSRIAYFIFSWLITRIVLILAFYLVVAPIGLFTRFTGRDLLSLKIDKDSSSYWFRRERKVPDPKQYEKQF